MHPPINQQIGIKPVKLELKGFIKIRPIIKPKIDIGQENLTWTWNSQFYFLRI